jgi:hypothetical protein
MVPAVHADLITEVTKFNGTVTDVGVVRGPGQIGGVEYRIKGKFTYTGPIDLTSSTFTLEQAFVEPDSAPGAGDGAGELMRQSQGLGGPETDPPLVPITLLSNHGESDEAKYDTPGRFRPQIRVKVKNKEGEFEFDVRLDRGLMRQRPKRCALESDGRTRTLITISFTIADDRGNPPLTVTTTNKWECSQPDRYHMRSR